MSYAEKDGEVTLTMKREDYERLLLCLGMATAAARNRWPIVELLNRINQGNPAWTPYIVPVAATPEQKRW